jgi:hypothetical protein
MAPDGSAGKEEVLELKNELKERKEAGYRFKTKIQEYRAKIEEREKWMTRFWKERLTYLGIISGLVVGLVSSVIVMLT